MLLLLILFSIELWSIESFSFSKSSGGALAKFKELRALKVETVWVPIGNVGDLDTSAPTAVEIAERKYVAWRNPLHSAEDPVRGWSVMDDVCPHRFAPLSEGRVDPASGCIECPYHGWQFEGGGQCTLVPQQQPNLKFTAQTSSISSATSYPVHFTNDVLWAKLPAMQLTNHSMTDFNSLPEQLNPHYNLPNMAAAVVDLPYSFDFAVENLIDPAHVPFAHHTLQGTRDDATLVNVKPQSTIDNTSHIELLYTDRTGQKYREGIISFRPPFHYSMADNRTFGKPKPNAPFPAPLTRKLTLTIVPVKAGMTRLFLWAPTPKNFFFNAMKWLIHGYLNTFLESDLWVHNIEQYSRTNPSSCGDQSGVDTKEEWDSLLGKRIKVERQYAFLTPSDRAITLWRRWWIKHMAHIPLFGAASADQLSPLSEARLRDRYESHVRHCKHCLGVLKNIYTAERILPVISLAIIALTCTRRWFVRLIGPSVYLLGQVLLGFMKKTILGKERWETISVARKEKR